MVSVLNKQSGVLNAANAKEAVLSVFEDYAKHRDFWKENEATTRIEVIDRVLSCLGWAAPDINRESPTGVGDFLDYELIHEGDPWLLVEAKRSGATFSTNKAELAIKDNRIPISTLRRIGGKTLREVMDQCANYSNNRAIPLCLATNGLQWLFFRGLSSEANPWHAGDAIIFDGPNEIRARFDEFFSYLSRDKVGLSYLSEQLEKFASFKVPPSVTPIDHIEVIRPELDPAESATVRAICAEYFTHLVGHERSEMLRYCYVEPGTKAAEFEQSVERLLRDNSYPFNETADVVRDGDTKKFHDEITRQENLSPLRECIVVVGHVGAGKTTFIHKTLARFRDEYTITAIVDIEGFAEGGTFDVRIEESRVADSITRKLARAAGTAVKNNPEVSSRELKQCDPTDPDTLKTIFRSDLEAEKRLGSKVWQADPLAWDLKEYDLLKEKTSDKIALLRHFIRHLANRFKKEDGSRYPILIVLDNLDQSTEEYQRCIYGFAQRLARETSATLVVCLREDTFMEGRQPGGFLTSSTLPLVFHVAAPPLDKVIRNRVKYVEYGLSEKGRLAGRLSETIPTIEKSASLLRNSILAKKSQSLEMLKCLSGSNVRDSLGHLRYFLVGSTAFPSRQADPSAEFFLDCIYAAVGRDTYEARMMLYNCFDAEPSSPPFHALRSRLLAFYSYANDHPQDRSFLEQTERVIGRFAAWGYPVSYVRSALIELWQAELLKSFQETERGRMDDNRTLPSRLTLTPKGYAHLHHLIKIPAFRAAMACEMKWYDDGLVKEFIQKAQGAASKHGASIGDIAESSALLVFDTYLKKQADQETQYLAGEFTKSAHWTTEVSTRSQLFELVSKRGFKVHYDTAQVEVQRSLFGKIDDNLPRISRQLRYEGTSWIPRVLWALEWARGNGRGPLSASEIAKVLVEYGDLDVPRNNVARAFRDLKGQERANGLWVVSGKRYSITGAGTDLLKALMHDQ